MRTYNVYQSSNISKRRSTRPYIYKKTNSKKLFRMFALLILILLFSAILIRVNIASANAKDNIVYSEQEKLCYKTIQIQEGDTLWDLADDYVEAGMSSKPEYIKKIKEINHIYDDNIYAGSYLILPYYQQHL